ncbi:MAG: hypothetical protein KF781_09045 [Chitinophagaceae bacterium]|nr:hypothetical protein [Chitinophagaceae bacterium]MCW5905038.1 hypothetical protein [Chitinophagaceae bacterium]
MKQFFIIALFTTAMLFSNTSNAQKWRMGVSIMPGVASNGGYGFTLGADVRLQTKIMDKAQFILTTGVTEFFKKNNLSSMGYIPLKPGVKYFWGENFYTAGEIGIGFGLVKGSGRSFIWSPSVGLAFKKFDISLKYEDATDFGKYTKHFALRLARGFELK